MEAEHPVKGSVHWERESHTKGAVMFPFVLFWLGKGKGKGLGLGWSGDPAFPNVSHCAGVQLVLGTKIYHVYPPVLI